MMDIMPTMWTFQDNDRPLNGAALNTFECQTNG